MKKWLKWRLLFVANTGISYNLSHLIMDYFRADNREPFGIPLFWPFNNQHWISSMQFFYRIQHGIPGDNLHAFLNQLFPWHNLTAVVVEIIVLLPITLLTFLATRIKQDKAPPVREYANSTRSMNYIHS